MTTYQAALPAARRQEFCVKHLIFALTLLSCAGAVAGPRPLVMTETQQLVLPDTRYSFTMQSAIDGDSLIALATEPRQPEDPANVSAHVHALLYTRDASGRWNFSRDLARVSSISDAGNEFLTAVAMKDGIAAVQLGALMIFERGTSSSTYVPKPLMPEIRPYGRNLVIDSGRILAGMGRCGADARVLERDAAGTWIVSGVIDGPDFPCSTASLEHDIALSGDRALVWVTIPDEFTREARVYERPARGRVWRYLTTLRPPEGGAIIDDGAALGANLAFLSSDQGTAVFRSTAPTNWPQVTQLRPLDFALDRGYSRFIRLRDGLVLQSLDGSDTGKSYLDIYRQRDDQQFEQVASLRLADPASVFEAPDISGQNVVWGNHVFRLPQPVRAPTPVFDNFESAAMNWTPSSGQFAVTPSGSKHVYRQSSDTGAANAVLDNVDWTTQSIEAEITPLAFNGNDRWVGVAIRYVDANNYYYITVRSGTQFLLRKIVNGVVSTVGVIPTRNPATVNTVYHVRLQAVGNQISATVNSNRAAVTDNSLTHGSAALLTYKARADFDNVMVTPSPLETIFVADFDDEGHDIDGPWDSRAGTWVDGELAFMQTSTAGDGRIVIGSAVPDQSVTTAVRIDQFATSAPNSDPWVGVAARVVDDVDYYYVTLRRSNQIQIRKITGGRATTLAAAPFTVVPGRDYAIRFDVVGTSLRMYVDGVLRLEAEDSTFSEGQVGLLTYKAAASFDFFSAVQP